MSTYMSANESYLTPDLAKAFLAKHPSVQWIDIFMHDVNGIARGKRIRSSDLEGFAGKGFMVPSTCYIMDMRGSCVEETGRLWETGDPDLSLKILAETLAPVSVKDTTHAQAVMVPVEDDGGLDPRRLLQRQVANLAKSGFHPVTAVELEFYVSAAAPRGKCKLQPPGDLEDNPDWQQLYQFEDLYAVAKGRWCVGPVSGWIFNRLLDEVRCRSRCAWRRVHMLVAGGRCAAPTRGAANQRCNCHG